MYRCRQGPFVLSMSPGFFGFYAHIGALIALEEEGLLQEASAAVWLASAAREGCFCTVVADGVVRGDSGELLLSSLRCSC